MVIESTATSPQTVTVKGDTASSVADNIELSADIGSGDCFTEKFTVIKVVSVKIAKPDTTWAALPWSNVLLQGQDLKVKILISPAMPSLAGLLVSLPLEAELRTFSISPGGAEAVLNTAAVPVTMSNAVLTGGTEIRLTVPAAEVLSLGLVSYDEDGIEGEKTSADSVDVLTGPSNRNDSDAFDATAAGVQRGLARGTGDIVKNPPEGAFHKTVLQAAGAVLVDVEVCSAKSEKRQVQQQADSFYYSGHGDHGSAKTAIGGPTDVNPYWKDIDEVFIAGCAVLDINDYNMNYSGPAHTRSPGEDWAALAKPELFFGYNWKAPFDNSGGNPGFTASIITSYLSSAGPKVLRWMNANKAKATTPNRKKAGQRPWNACVIDMNGSIGTYWFFDYNNLVGGKPSLNFRDQTQW